MCFEVANTGQINFLSPVDQFLDGHAVKTPAKIILTMMFSLFKAQDPLMLEVYRGRSNTPSEVIMPPRHSVPPEVNVK